MFSIKYVRPNTAAASRPTPSTSQSAVDHVDTVIFKELKAKIVRRGLSSFKKTPEEQAAKKHIQEWILIAQALTNETINSLEKFESLDSDTQTKTRYFMLGSEKTSFNPVQIKKMKEKALQLFINIKAQLNNNFEEKINVVQSDNPENIKDLAGFMIKSDVDKKRVFFPADRILNPLKIENRKLDNAMTLIHEVSHHFGTKDYWYNAAGTVYDHKNSSLEAYLNRFTAIADNEPGAYEPGDHIGEVDLDKFESNKMKRMLYILNNAANVEALSLILARRVVNKYTKNNTN